MQDILKEMGLVCKNKKTAEEFQSLHRQCFNEVFLMNREQAEAHKMHFLFWSEKVKDMNDHIKQLHEQLRSI
jgi:hypothetical protein